MGTDARRITIMIMVMMMPMMIWWHQWHLLRFNKFASAWKKHAEKSTVIDPDRDTQNRVESCLYRLSRLCLSLSGPHCAFNCSMAGWLDGLSTRNAPHSGHTTVIDDTAGTWLGFSSSTEFGLRVLFSWQIIRCMLPLRRFWLKWHDTHIHTHTNGSGMLIWIVYKPLQLPIWLQFYLKCQKAHFGFFLFSHPPHFLHVVECAF